MTATKTRIASIFCISLAGWLGVCAGAPASASADVTGCATRPGYLKFWDQATNRCGYVAGTNHDWGLLPGGWFHRADQYVNNGNTHNACVYYGTFFSMSVYHIARGARVDRTDWAGSNSWTRNGFCTLSQ